MNSESFSFGMGTIYVCVLCDWGRNMREGDGERKVRVVGLGRLLSASPGRQPSVHTNLALRRCHTATTHALMSCDIHYATVFGRSSGKYLFHPLYDHGFRSL